MEMNNDHFDIISERAVNDIFGFPREVPLSSRALAGSLKVTFYPGTSVTERVAGFSRRLRQTLVGCGVNIIDYEDALEEGNRTTIKENIVVIAPGELQTGNLPVDHVSNLRTTTVVGIVDGPCPADAEPSLQGKLNSVVRTLAWSIVQIVLFVDAASWTICTMNGAIIRCDNAGSFEMQVFSTLVPKLAAPVVPPHASDFEVHEGALDLSSGRHAAYVNDFVQSGPLWARSGLMLFHTSLDTLKFRNRYYQRLAAAYLDNRSGMSYGFLAHQLPVEVGPSVTPVEADRAFGKRDWSGSGVLHARGRRYTALRIQERLLIVEVPDVWVLTTRSGCNKSKIDATRDVVMMGLAEGGSFWKRQKA